MSDLIVLVLLIWFLYLVIAALFPKPPVGYIVVKQQGRRPGPDPMWAERRRYVRLIGRGNRKR